MAWLGVNWVELGLAWPQVSPKGAQVSPKTRTCACVTHLRLKLAQRFCSLACALPVETDMASPRNAPGKTPNVGWTCAVMKYENLGLGGDSQEGERCQWIYLAKGPAGERSVQYHGWQPSGWHGTWSEGELNDFFISFNARGIGKESGEREPPLRAAYVHKTTEKVMGQPVYRGHDYAGRQLKLVLDSIWTVDAERNWESLWDNYL